MSLQDDFDAATAASLQAELDRFGNDCWYDPRRKRIIYNSPDAALHAYMILQALEMERHKWIESEKAAHDLREFSLSDWVRKHSMAFRRYWHRTHVFAVSSGQTRPFDASAMR